VNGDKEGKITSCESDRNLMSKWKICYTEVTNLLQFTINVMLIAF